MTEIGITGGAGVLGSLLKKKLSRQNIDYSCFEGDIRKITDIKRWIDKNKNLRKIIHLAALVATEEVEKNKKTAINTNFIGTKNLINIFKKKEIKN